MPTVACAVGILLLATVLLSARLDQRELWPSHEARAAQEAVGLLETGNFGVLRLYDGTPDYQKPPLYYWLVAGVAWLRGGIVDALSVRLPAVCAGFLTMLGVAIWLWKLGRPIAALVAALSLLCANHFIATSRTGRIDAPLMLCVMMSIFCWVENRRILAGLALGAAILLKGPIGIILVLPVVAVIRGRKAALSPIIVAALLAAPWFIFATIQTDGEYASSFFWHHNFQRATGTSIDLASHPVGFYLGRWIIDWFPATPALMVAIWIASRRSLWTGDTELKIGVVWVAVMSIVLSCARFKRADYLMPAYPGMAILIGCLAERIHQVDHRRRWLVAMGACTLAASVLIAVCYEVVIVPRENQVRGRQVIAAELESLRELGQPIIMFRVEDHLLTFHLGKPIHFVKEWENLDVWVARLPSGLVILTPEDATLWTHYISAGKLREVFRHHDTARSRTFVVMQSCPNWIAGSP